ncbi:hypothetical protein [Xenorhabdus bovienii]|uniref:hypothetical protein n=1 Tax=Xenorhabdus bovienii TaxID=40576 RepID=UPI0023B34DCE|nr:hypothetical protein [Xenorhabdus bovienii]MDE9544187.1 hypothetical protein [Xenorhabdus bovienii]
MTAKVIMNIPFNQPKTFVLVYKGLNVERKPVNVECQPRRYTCLDELVIKTDQLKEMGYFEIIATEVF